MNMIEKLGITPIDLDDYENVDHAIGKPIRELEQQRNEMLEALIEVIKTDLDYNGYSYMFPELIPIVEKATGKTWEEIKELIND